MRKGTFSQQRATSNSSAHNSRVNPPKYLIGLEAGTNNHYELLQNDDDFIDDAQKIYKEKIKQKMQKKQVENLILETVLTLQKHQNENDVKNLFIELNKKYGGHELLEVSVHRDEGHFSKNGIAYYPTKNILKKDDEWYICSDPNIEKPKKEDFDKKVDINKFEKVYNYHAHAKFSMFDRSLGKSARMQKKDMSERLKFVSNYLGLKYDPATKIAGRKSVNQIKDEHLAASNTKRQELAKVKDLKAEVKKLKTEIKLTQTNHKELRIFEKELHSKIKDKDLSIEDLQHQVATLKSDFERGNEVYQNLQTKSFEIEQEKQTLENSNKALQEQKNTLEVKVHDFEEKTLSRQNMSDYEAQNKDIKILNTHLEDNFEDFNKLEDKPKTSIFRKCVNFLIKKVEDLTKKVFDLEDRNKELKTENEELKNELQSKETTILGLENENKLQEWEIKELKEKINSNPKKSQTQSLNR